MSLNDTHEDDEKTVSAYYGILPTLAGIAAAVAVIALMFALADGFA